MLVDVSLEQILDTHLLSLKDPGGIARAWEWIVQFS
jgi:hypothetical protein